MILIGCLGCCNVFFCNKKLQKKKKKRTIKKKNQFSHTCDKYICHESEAFQINAAFYFYLFYYYYFLRTTGLSISFLYFSVLEIFLKFTLGSK